VARGPRLDFLLDPCFIAEPARTLSLPRDYEQRVKDVHERGGYGSTGYGTTWSPDEAAKNVLRTHTTAVSSRMLYALANVRDASNSTPESSVIWNESPSLRVFSRMQQPGGFKPAKYFSIDRVFRNESLDATHLAEFHQVSADRETRSSIHPLRLTLQ
jgi:phenylalanyl-tRNA synthetase alpha chain